MALIWAEGFDHYGTSPNGGRTAMLSGAWANIVGSPAPFVSGTQKRTGDYSFNLSNNSLGSPPVIRRVLGATQTVIGLAMGWYFGSLPVDNKHFGFKFLNNANNTIAYIAIQSDGSIALYRGVSETLFAVSDPIISATSWQHVECKLHVDNIVGSCEVRVNGITVLHVTDVDFGTLGCTQVSFGTYSNLAGTLTLYLDDIVAWNDVGTGVNNFVGPARVQTLFPSSNEATQDWSVVGAASGYEAINQATPDGDTTYISANTLNDTSEFGLPTLPPETANIRGVYIPLMGKLNDAGTGNVQASLVSGIDISNGPDQTLTTSYNYWGGSHEFDPATGLPWTKSGLEAAILRVEKTV